MNGRRTFGYFGTISAPIIHRLLAMTKDVLDDLKSWLAHVRDEKEIRQRMGRTPEREIDRLERAIEEIERLRAITKNPIVG